MPLKGFKPFNRRKSSTYDLDDAIQNPPASSFRVLERPHETEKSFDGGHNLRRAAAADPRPMSAGKLTDLPELKVQGNRYVHVPDSSNPSKFN